jgi:two-component system, sporulation sensor kinase B
MFGEDLIGQILFNLLLILIPIYFYNFIFPYLHKTTVQVLSGILFGITTILSMVFPIVYGEGFLWDLRWIPFIICVLYMGHLSGIICGSMLIVCRFILGGFIASLVVAICAIILFVTFMWIRRYYYLLRLPMKYAHNAFLAIFTFLVVFSAIWINFALIDKLDYLYNLNSGLFLMIGASYIISILTYTYFTEFIRSNIKLMDQLHKAEKFSIVSELAASIAHEVRNPLTVVRGFIQLAQEKIDLQEKKYLRTAIDELDRAEHIITDYLTFAKPTLNNKIEEYSVSDCLNELILLMESYANLKGITLENYVESGISLKGDCSKFKQAIVNLIKNAIEATNEGVVSIYASHHPNSEVLLIRIKDTGEGMSNEQLRRIGDPYFTTKAEGTGLGLLVTFRLIESMNGTLSFESVEQVGTSAIVQFKNVKHINMNDPLSHNTMNVFS